MTDIDQGSVCFLVPAGMLPPSEDALLRAWASEEAIGVNAQILPGPFLVRRLFDDSVVMVEFPAWRYRLAPSKEERCDTASS